MKSMLFSHRKLVRALIGGGSACALIAAGAFVPLRNAVADDAITGQDYVSYYHLDQVKAKGIPVRESRLHLLVAWSIPLPLNLPGHQLLIKARANLILLHKR